MVRSAIALGFFDGVHIAHQKIIKAAAHCAESNGWRGVALTFDRSPAEVIFDAPRSCLTDNAEKTALISALGAECVMLKTDGELLKMSGECFVREILVEKMNAAALFCGYNYTFGSDRLTAARLEEIGEKYGLSVEILPDEKIDGASVSSSRIRELLREGDMEAAAKLLGRAYSVTGVVEQGKGLGRTKGFPTVNIYPEADRLFIPHGVYASWVAFGKERHVGVTNFGMNPTVGDKNIRIETHILDFSGDLYGQSVTTEFVRFVRPERKFSSTDGLFAQISADRDTVRKIMESRQT